MKKMNEEKLAEMARYIKEYIEQYGDSPKFGQILEHMGMSNSVGYRYLMTLRDRGVNAYSKELKIGENTWLRLPA